MEARGKDHRIFLAHQRGEARFDAGVDLVLARDEARGARAHGRVLGGGRLGGGETEVVVAAKARDAMAVELVVRALAVTDRGQASLEAGEAVAFESATQAFVEMGRVPGHDWRMVGAFGSRRERAFVPVFVEFRGDKGEVGRVMDASAADSWPLSLRTRVEQRSDGAARLAQMAGLVSKYARSLNLTGSQGEELWRQIGEGVAAVVAVERALGRSLLAEDAWFDIGSGGGFPGLVIAALVEAQVFLVEPRQKRVAFLELGMGSLGRRSLPVFRGRLEGGRVAGRDGDRFLRVLAEHRAGPGVSVWGARAVFSPEEWVVRCREVAHDGDLVVLHLGLGVGLPGGFEELARQDYEGWSVVVGRHL